MVDQFPGVYVRHFRGLEQLRQFYRRGRSIPEPVEVVWIYGPSGTGKSTLANLVESKAYWKANGQWWDGYDDHDSVVWDDFSGRYYFRDLLVVLDRFNCKVEKKGGTCEMMASKFIFTSNAPPWMFYTGTEGVTHEALMRRISLFVHKLSFDKANFYLTSEEAKANFNE